MDNVQNISFNIYADNEEEAAELKGAIVGFINWFAKRGIKVRAGKVATALNKWESNPIIKNRVINYMNNG